MPPTKKAAAKKTAAKKTTGARPASRVAREVTDEQRTEAVRAAEAAGQRAVIRRRKYTAAEQAKLDKALDRRVEVNLASTGGHPVASVAGADAEVARLEAPFKPRPAAGGDGPEQSSGSLVNNAPEEE